MRAEQGLILEALDASEASLARFEALLGAEDFGGCFCAVWTSFDSTWSARCRDPDRPNLAIAKRDVQAGRKAGYFVVVEGEPVGWIGAGPRRQFPLLATKLASRLAVDHIDGVWSIGCMAFLARSRGRGLAEGAVLALIEAARSAGARRVEAYPVRPWDEPRSYRGSHTLYERLGFEVVGSEPDGDAEVLLMALVL